jgi:hypothetical protein
MAPGPANPIYKRLINKCTLGKQILTDAELFTM